ncbi:MAG: hypothetical protein IJZ94_05095 [Clostridia bacterium]|nr:hypothetical protein [Clostridia bacterium]
MKKFNLFLISLLTFCLFITGCVSTNNEGNTVDNTESLPIVTSGDIEGSPETEHDNKVNNNTEASQDKSTTAPHVHDYSSATCAEPQICISCGATNGKPAGHDWKDATCTSPKTCVSCGITDGTAAGHDWKDATCTSPKTCVSCGITDGTAAGHNYVSGECTSCGASDPSYSIGNMVWIPRTGSKYHSKSNCSNMKNPTQVTQSQAISRGYEPCKKCY